MSEFQTYGDYRRSRGDARPPMQDSDRPKKRQRIAPPRDEELGDNPGQSHEEKDSRWFRPSMLSFKSFLLTQDDSITDDEALSKFSEYKQEFNRQQLNEFFVAHKDEEWFREKYHPDLRANRHKLSSIGLKERLDMFMELYNQGMMKELRLESGRSHDIETLLDCFVLRLEGGTEEDAKKLVANESIEEELHRTSSIHFKSLHPGVKREEVEALCKKYPGFLRLFLSDPVPEKKWMRKGWVTFTRDTKIKEICFSMGTVRFKDVELGPVLNKDLSRRIRTISTLANDKKVMRNDIKEASNLIRELDKRWDLWETKVDEIVGEKSANPILENITEYLIEEMSAEEDELLGFSSSEQDERKVESNEELSQVMDRLVVYLRMVHSLDFYAAAHYHTEDEMPNRCGIFHVRERPTNQQISEAEVSDYIEEFNKKLSTLKKTWAVLSDEQASKLGTKDEKEAVEIFVQANTEDLGNEKYMCPLSGKKFKGADFVRKHIFNKHGEKVENVKKDVEFFNNYIKDPNRPNLPVRPKPAAKPKPVGETRVEEPSRHQSREPAEERPRGSVKDRLGYKSSAMRVTHAVSDPRGMVDYSDVDLF